MAKLFKFETVLKDLVNFYNVKHISINDYPRFTFDYENTFFHNNYRIFVRVYHLYFNDITHYAICINVNDRVYKCLSFNKEPIDVILSFLESCLGSDK